MVSSQGLLFRLVRNSRRKSLTQSSRNLILVLTSVWTRNWRHGPTKPPYRRVKATLIPNAHFVALPETIKQSVGAVADYFPEPENTADGARQTIRNKFDRKEPRPLA